MPMLAVDFNHWKKVSSWPALAAAVDAIILKATQYTTFTDGDFAGNLTQARKTGKLIGVYHFVGRNGMQTAKLPPGDPTAEADWFLSRYAHQPGEMIIVDWEPDAEPADPDGWLAAHCARIRTVTGVVPVVYMNSSTARARSWAKTRALGCALWVAQYGANNGQPGATPTVGTWGSFIGWQYTSNGTLPGISAQVDLSRFDLTPDQWRAYGGAGTPEDDLTPDQAKQLDNIERMLGAVGAVDINLPTERTIGAQVADIQTALTNDLPILTAAAKAQDPQALAAAVVAAMGTEFAQKVIDALGQRINAAQPS